MSDVTIRRKVVCPECKGKGKVVKDVKLKIWKACPKCNGKTYVLDIQHLTV